MRPDADSVDAAHSGMMLKLANAATSLNAYGLLRGQSKQEITNAASTGTKYSSISRVAQPKRSCRKEGKCGLPCPSAQQQGLPRPDMPEARPRGLATCWTERQACGCISASMLSRSWQSMCEGADQHVSRQAAYLAPAKTFLHLQPPVDLAVSSW